MQTLLTNKNNAYLPDFQTLNTILSTLEDCLDDDCLLAVQLSLEATPHCRDAALIHGLENLRTNYRSYLEMLERLPAGVVTRAWKKLNELETLIHSLALSLN